MKPPLRIHGLALVVLIPTVVACGSASPGATSTEGTSTGIPTAPAVSVQPTPAVDSPAVGSRSPAAVEPTIDPGWVTRPALTCGDPDRVFPPEALSGPGQAELGTDPPAAVLRSTVTTAPAETPFPEHGWHRVLDDPRGVTFVAAGAGGTPWWQVSVGLLDGVLQATEYGACRLAITAPAGVSFGRWWLDPGAPAPTRDGVEVSILVREQVCASGRSPEGRLLAPTIVLRADAIEVAIGIHRRAGGQDCPGNPTYPMRLRLPEPLGARALFDASQYPPRPATTEDPG